jgi:hypothetical protein
VSYAAQVSLFQQLKTGAGSRIRTDDLLITNHHEKASENVRTIHRIGPATAPKNYLATTKSNRLHFSTFSCASMREVKRKVPCDTALVFHSGFAKPINYQFFSLSPRPWMAILRFSVKKQIPINKLNLVIETPREVWG